MRERPIIFSGEMVRAILDRRKRQTRRVIKPLPWVDKRDAFMLLWNSINEKRGHGWDKNPWVWVIDFERVE